MMKKISKQLVSFSAARLITAALLTLFMLLALMPVGAMAVETGPINLIDATEDKSGEGWSWVQSSKTLTLNGANIVGADIGSMDGAGDSYGISLPAGANLVYTGSNDVRGGNNQQSGMKSAAIFCVGDLSIQGIDGGTLIATGGTAAYSYGIYFEGETNSVIGEAGVTLKATGGTATVESAGIRCHNNDNTAALTVNGGTLNAYGGKANGSYGIYAAGVVSVKNAGTAVRAEGSKNVLASNEVMISCGLSSKTGVSVTGGANLTANGGSANAGGGTSYGIYISDNNNSYLKIDGSDTMVIARGEAANEVSAGIYCLAGVSNSTSSVEFRGSSLNAAGNTAKKSYGIYCKSEVTQNDAGAMSTASVVLAGSEVYAGGSTANNVDSSYGVFIEATNSATPANIKRSYSCTASGPNISGKTGTVNMPTEKPVFAEGKDTAAIKGNDGASFEHETSYFGSERVYKLYDSEDAMSEVVGVTATKGSWGKYFTVNGEVPVKTELWVSVTEGNREESERTKITVYPYYDKADGGDVLIKTPQDLQDYLQYLDPDCSTIDGDTTVTLNKDVALLHKLYFGWYGDDTPDDDFVGIWDLGGKTVSDYVNAKPIQLQTPGSKLTIKNGSFNCTGENRDGAIHVFEATLELQDVEINSSKGRALQLEDGKTLIKNSVLYGKKCALEMDDYEGAPDATLENVTLIGGDYALSCNDSKLKLTNVDIAIENGDENVGPTTALSIWGNTDVSFVSGTLSNDNEEGLTYLSDKPLSECLAAGSASDVESVEGAGGHYCTETVTVTVSDPDAFKPINGGVTVKTNGSAFTDNGVYANGNAITLVAGATENGKVKTNIYYTGDPEKKPITLTGLTGNTETGYDLTNQKIFGGSCGKDVENTDISMKGGGVQYLFGGGFKCNVTGTANIAMEGGAASYIHAGTSDDGYDSYRVEKAVVKVTGGNVYEELRGYGTNGGNTYIGFCEMTVAGDAVVKAVRFNSFTYRKLTVGGNVKIEKLFLRSVDTGNPDNHVEYFEIEPDLSSTASVKIYYRGKPTNLIVATSATASDLRQVTINNGSADADCYRLELVDTDIKLVRIVHSISGKLMDHEGTALGSCEVELKQGKNTIETDTTNSYGEYKFDKVPAGVYNLVATHASGKVVTKLVTVVDRDLERQNLVMPEGNNSSVVVVEGDDTPEVVVGGLDELAGAETTPEPGQTVTIKLAVESKDESDSSAQPQIAAVKALAGSKDISNFIDLSLTKIVEGTGSSTTPITDTTGTKILEIVVPYDFTGKKDIAVYRYHGTEAEALTALGSKPEENALADKTFYADSENGLIHIYTGKFSIYALAYTADTATPPPSGGGGGSLTYLVEIAKTQNGSVSAVPTRAQQGETVTITAKPDEGYAVDKLVVKDKDGKEIPVTDKGNGSYTFIQPGGEVIVTVTFKSAKSELPFIDVGLNDWFYDSVKYVYDKGLMSGTSGNTFSPSLSTSRGMIATVIWRMEGEPAAKAAAGFTDVTADKYYAAAVAWGTENGIVEGYGNGCYGPDDLITREQLAAILYRYARFKAMDTSASSDLKQFSDQPSAWAAESMRWAVGAGVVSGRGNGSLDATGHASRAETAAMLARFLKK